MLTYQRLISWTKTEKVEMSRIGAAVVPPCSALSYLEIDTNYYVIIKFYIISYKLSLYRYRYICPALLVQQQCQPAQLLHLEVFAGPHRAHLAVEAHHGLQEGVQARADTQVVLVCGLVQATFVQILFILGYQISALFCDMISTGVNLQHEIILNY